MDISSFRKIALKFVIILGFIMFGLILWQIIFRNINISVALSNDKRAFVLLFGVAIVLLLYKYLDFVLSKCNEKSIRCLKLFVVAAVVFIQLLVLYTVINKKAYPNTDLAVATDSAIRMLENYYFPLNSNILRYTQNRFFILVLYYFYKLLNAIGISCFWEMSIILNFLVIDVSAFLAYLCFKNINKKEKDLFWLVCALAFNPFLYLWFPYYYTSVLSIPFMMGTILCLQVFIFGKRNKRYLIMAGLLAAIAFQIRVVTLIPIIAFFLFGIFNFKSDKMKYCWKGYLNNTGLFLIVFILLSAFLQKSINMHTMDLPKNKEFPSTHYVMMGLQGDGRYAAEDVRYTESFDTKEEKAAANIVEIKKRLKNLGIFGYMDLLERKISLTWADGYDGYTDWYSLKYPIFAGMHKDFLIYYCQINRALSFFFVLIYCGQAWKRKEASNKFLIYELTLIGAIIFYALWEANAKYSVGFNFILIILSAAGMSMVPPIQKRVNKQLCTAVLLFAFFQICIIAYSYMGTNKSKEKYILCQNYRNAYIGGISENEGSISQSFFVKKRFNQIMIGVKKNGDTQEHGYNFTLRSKDGILYSSDFGNVNTEYQGDFIIFNLEQMIKTYDKEMWIEIRGIGERKDNLEFAVENSKLDYAPDCYLWLAGDEQEDNDLTFIVSRYLQ